MFDAAPLLAAYALSLEARRAAVEVEPDAILLLDYQESFSGSSCLGCGAPRRKRTCDYCGRNDP